MKTVIITLFTLFCGSASAAIAVLNGLTHVHQTSSGAQIQGSIKLRNDGEKAEKVILYLQDLQPSCSPELQYIPPSTAFARGLKSLKLEKDEQVLNPGEEAEIKYTLLAPDLTEGSFWQVIMVEGAAPVKKEVVQGLQVNSKVRYAVQVVVNVGTVLSPPLVFEEIKLAEKNELHLRLKNQGDFVGLVKVKLEILTQNGERIQTQETIYRRSFPQGCVHFSLSIPSIPKGKYAGILIADNGKDLFGTQLILDL
jgi:hypothetical protein